MTKDEAMKLALEALIASHPIANTDKSLDKHSKAMSALRQTLEQPEQEPVAWRQSNGIIEPVYGATIPIGTPLYTAPPKREWVGLTDEEEIELDEKYGDDFNAYIDARDAKLKEKNA